MYLSVYVLDVPYHIDRPFDYLCPPEWGQGCRRGSLVRVPFGKNNHLRCGVVVALSDRTDDPSIVKPAHAVLDDILSLSEEMLGLCLFLKEYTLCTFTEAVRTVLPPGALTDIPSVNTQRTVRLLLSPAETQALLDVTGRAGVRSQPQRVLLRYLMPIGEADFSLLRALPGVDSSHVRALCRRGVLAVEEREQIRNPYAHYARERDTSPIVLTPAQTAAYEKIEDLRCAGAARAALLFGVTGSGKTKVIMRVIDRTVAEGRSVIMLVPEISLTPQTVRLFCSRYGERVAVIHSSLSKGERFDAWRRIRRGDVDLVIGTRSAIFAPLPNLGLIVMDEEHEHTYKSEMDPKYHARDVAAYRCGQRGCLLLLASATPSLESFYKARSGKYTLVPLRERYGGMRLPDAVIIDMREELRLGNTSPISQRLHDALGQVWEREEQAILFLNRRGYNSQVSCKECGEVLTCRRCSVSLTYHTDKDGGHMLCHLCGYSEPVPRRCPACGGEHLSFLGYGTQKVESELHKYLPDMRILRMDADTTSTKLAYDRMLEDFREQKADILLGTQMVAKGHDFPKVTLVGVALADTSLYMSDFRASERTFSLLTQVIGRAGRAGAGGIAIIQTYSPGNEIIRLACTQDYEKFYEGEIALRRALSYPPFCDMVQLTLTGEDEVALHRRVAELHRRVLELLGGDAYAGLPFVVFGPFEAGVYKVNEKYRMRMVIKCRLNTATRRFFHQLLCEFSPLRDVVLSVDLNPLTV